MPRRELTESGPVVTQPNGPHLNLWDISDVTQPRRLDSLRLEGIDYGDQTDDVPLGTLGRVIEQAFVDVADVFDVELAKRHDSSNPLAAADAADFQQL